MVLEGRFVPSRQRLSVTVGEMLLSANVADDLQQLQQESSVGSSSAFLAVSGMMSGASRRSRSRSRSGSVLVDPSAYDAALQEAMSQSRRPSSIGKTASQQEGGLHDSQMVDSREGSLGRSSTAADGRRKSVAPSFGAPIESPSTMMPPNDAILETITAPPAGNESGDGGNSSATGRQSPIVRFEDLRGATGSRARTLRVGGKGPLTTLPRKRAAIKKQRSPAEGGGRQSPLPRRSPLESPSTDDLPSDSSGRNGSNLNAATATDDDVRQLHLLNQQRSFKAFGIGKSKEGRQLRDVSKSYQVQDAIMKDGDGLMALGDVGKSAKQQHSAMTSPKHMKEMGRKRTSPTHGEDGSLHADEEEFEMDSEASFDIPCHGGGGERKHCARAKHDENNLFFDEEMDELPRNGDEENCEQKGEEEEKEETRALVERRRQCDESGSGHVNANAVNAFNRFFASLQCMHGDRSAVPLQLSGQREVPLQRYPHQHKNATAKPKGADKVPSTSAEPPKKRSDKGIDSSPSSAALSSSHINPTMQTADELATSVGSFGNSSFPRTTAPQPAMEASSGRKRRGSSLVAAKPVEDAPDVHQMLHSPTNSFNIDGGFNKPRRRRMSSMSPMQGAIVGSHNAEILAAAGAAAGGDEQQQQVTTPSSLSNSSFARSPRPRPSSPLSSSSSSPQLQQRRVSLGSSSSHHSVCEGDHGAPLMVLPPVLASKARKNEQRIEKQEHDTDEQRSTSPMDDRPSQSTHTPPPPPEDNPVVVVATASSLLELAKEKDIIAAAVVRKNKDGINASPSPKKRQQKIDEQQDIKELLASDTATDRDKELIAQINAQQDLDVLWSNLVTLRTVDKWGLQPSGTVQKSRIRHQLDETAPVVSSKHSHHKQKRSGQQRASAHRRKESVGSGGSEQSLERSGQSWGSTSLSMSFSPALPRQFKEPPPPVVNLYDSLTKRDFSGILEQQSVGRKGGRTAEEVSKHRPASVTEGIIPTTDTLARAEEKKKKKTSPPPPLRLSTSVDLPPATLQQKQGLQKERRKQRSQLLNNSLFKMMGVLQPGAPKWAPPQKAEYDHEAARKKRRELKQPRSAATKESKENSGVPLSEDNRDDEQFLQELLLRHRN